LKNVFRGPTRARKMVVLPDAHACPKYDNRRFDLLGAFLADEQPDLLVSLGDFNDIASLAHHGRGTSGAEGRRFTKDCEASWDAQERMGLGDKSPVKKMRRIMLLGNHEQRIHTYQAEHPELEGSLSVGHLGYDRFGWEVVPFKVRAIICGFAMAHYHVSGPMERPIAQTGKTLVQKLHMSAIQGHGHTLDVHEETKADGSKLMGVAAGCYTHPGAVETWNKGSAHMYWNGILVFEDARAGYCGELRRVTQDHLRRKYG
jgi:hypothetical protein